MAVRVLHLITGLETGGAETALHGLLRTLGSQEGARFEHQVVSLIRPGYMGGKIKELGVPVFHLGMDRGVPSPSALFRLVSILRTFRPHVLQTWLYHADLMGLIGSWLAVGVRVPVVWNLRCAYMDFSKYPRTTAWTVSALAKLSRFPAAVVANSRAAMKHHHGLGYRPRQGVVIPNGVDVDRYAPDAEARAVLRRELGLEPGSVLAGMAARFDPMKDVPTLLSALARVQNVDLLLCGQGMDKGNTTLRDWIVAAGLEGRVHLVGHRSDLEHVLPGLDLYVSSSLGESFPNVIAEALACSVPVVATEAGASRTLVSPAGSEPAAGRIVPVSDVPGLAQALGELAGMSQPEREAMGYIGRERVLMGYSWTACASRYSALYDSVAL